MLGQILISLDRAYTGFSELFDAVYEGAESGRQAIQGFVHFEFDPKFKTRVVSIPAGIQGFEDLWQTIRFDLLGKFQEIKSDVETVTQAIHSLPPKQPGEPILQRTALVLSYIHALNSRLAQMIRSILDMIRIIDDIRNRIETLDDLFLPNNSRKTLVDDRYRKRNA